MKYVLSFRIDSENKYIVRFRHVKFGMELDHTPDT
jgi:hypothetical protein